MALARGLIDGIGDLRSVMRARFGDKVRLVPIGRRRRRWWLPPGACGSAARRRAWAEAARELDGSKTRALWARFGL